MRLPRRSDTGLVCDWSGVEGMGLPSCERATCPGHREGDLLPFSGLYAGQTSFLSNREFYDASGPGSDRLPYVYPAAPGPRRRSGRGGTPTRMRRRRYNSLSYWPGCTENVMIVTDDDAAVDDHYNSNATATALREYSEVP